MKTDNVLLLGFFFMLVCSLIMITMIFTGTSYDVQIVNTILGEKGIMVEDKFFDYSVAGVFCGLLLVAVGFGLDEEEEE